MSNSQIFWLSLQDDDDLEQAHRKLGSELE